MTGEGFLSLGSEFVVALNRSYARSYAIGTGVYQCRVVDNNHAIVYCPEHTYSNNVTFEWFATPLSPTRHVADVTFR